MTGETKIPPNWKAFLQDNTNKKEQFTKEASGTQVCSLFKWFLHPKDGVGVKWIARGNLSG